MRKVKPKYKQLQFDTAIRNPERYKEILSTIIDYEGDLLDDDCLLNIMCEMYKRSIVTSSDIKIELIASENELKEKIIKVNKTRRADGGFPTGYQARFWTYMRTLSELGFVYARYGEELKISTVAKKLIKNEIDDQEAFSVQSLIFNRRSPYKNVSNNFNYFKFIIELLLRVNSINKKLSYYEFILTMYSKNGNVDDFLNEINKLNITTQEDLLFYLNEEYNETNKPKTILRDYPDVVIRMLRLMGFITIYSYDKLYISINKTNEQYINNLLLLDIAPINIQEIENANLYFYRANNYAKTFLNFIESQKQPNIINEHLYKLKLDNIIKDFELTEAKIIDLINLILNPINRTYPIIEFKYIPEPLKLEFYIALLLHLKFSSKMLIKPNYKIDDIGIPISHAPSNMGDIEIYGKALFWLVEVTLIKSRIQQLNNETTNVIRHIKQKEIATNMVRYLSLVAPIIHTDTEEFYQFQASKSKGEIYLRPYSFSQFIDALNKNIFEDMKDYTEKWL